MNFNTSSLKTKDRLAELLANAKTTLNKSNLIPPVPADLPDSVDKIPEIHVPIKSDGNIRDDKDDVRHEIQRKFNEDVRIAREKAELELKAKLKEIEDAKPKMSWNEEQQSAIDKGETGESFNLIGKAGTGKTTVAREVISNAIRNGKVGPLTESTKNLSSGAPGVAIVSFTNRAVKNIAKGFSADLRRNCLTVHKLLEFRPVPMTITAADGSAKNTMRFLPARNSANPLPASLKLIVFEESSMISTDLFGQLMDALPHECQMIFLGDLQQLPPVYGQAILGFKLLELPVIELTKIYRQAEGSPIISLAWRVASGDVIPKEEFEKITKEANGKVMLRPWKKRLDSFDALHIMNKLFEQFITNNIYDPNEDMVMIPFNKSFGTLEFNLNLAQFLGKRRGAMVHQIIAGFQKHYFAIGDKVLVERQEAIIEAIHINDQYRGILPMEPSTSLNRWGYYEIEGTETKHELTLEEVEAFMLAQSAKDDEQNEEAKQQASHVLICRNLDSDEIVEVRTTGEYSSCLFAYALTVHKCQGSEWRKCFLLIHNSHAVMINREMLYTAVTRAREELYVICEPDTFVKGVKTQRIKGNTIKEKAEYFKGKLEKELG